MKIALIIVSSLLTLAGGVRAEQTIQLRVSATIPPRACEYPNQCEPAPATAQTKATVDNGTILYVGSAPEVTEEGDLITVKF
jgi:hypothetical protein